MTPTPILLIEDSPEDVEVLRRAFRKLNFTRPVEHCATAARAWEYLHSKMGSGESSRRPCLILLDLNLPGEDGRSMLRRLKASDQFRSVPVIIFSTSTNSGDVDYCYEHGAAAYQVKLMDTEAQQHAIRAMLEYWFGAVVLAAP